MPVRYTPPRPEDLLARSGRDARHRRGARSRTGSATTCCSSLFDAGTVAAGVFTQNRFCAAPVTVCRRHLAQARGAIRALVVNAGNANAGTGEPGIADAEPTCAAVARTARLRRRRKCCRSRPASSWSRCRSRRSSRRCPQRRRRSPPDHWFAAVSRDHDDRHGAEGRVAPRRRRRRARHGHRHRQGRGDDPSRTWRRCWRSSPPTRRSRAPLLAALAREIADASFNCATVDGDTSTNDSFVIAATGNAAHRADRRAPTIRASRRFAPR